ncbi:MULTISPECIES: sensor histidine kinase [unclassified Cryobacterium]|uniref:sensor histidine kinase n=1 Tax=unclassified Cryobacterium TaxID=2649013 RepID=UPI002AB419C1|nr:MULTISPECIES: sensor histidine kinase [unclassified Cryobacterium]MDY7541018.1 sensor histidine kinase [Cryobacterium sp. 5B3]MEA9998438.1 sensor histidine kinase [Cryobacterium sp. RTS3]MEB0265551.1 sensor histidine kinase [Cryobacterium sp. 10I5]MEB0273899.1 sensor histidine kinase [Cryobacterium sp. 5B3]
MPPHWDTDAPWFDHDRALPFAGYGNRMPRTGRVLFPAIFSFLVQVPATVVLARYGRDFGHAGHDLGGELGAPRPGWFLAVALALIGPIVLLGARRFPGPVAAVCAAAAGALILLRPDIGLPYVALGFAIVLGIARGARVWVYASVAVAWTATIALAGTLGVPLQPARIAITTVALAALCAIGEGVRTRREQIRELRRRADARRQSAEQRERVRIARELHDVLAHSLSQINVQAGVGLHLIDSQPAKAAEALANIKLTSKNALDEVRTVLGILRSDIDGESGEGGGGAAPLTPEPDLTRLPALIDSYSAQGLHVELVAQLQLVSEATTAATQLALYRICQEALTNVLRHSQTRSATVRLELDDGDAVLTVTDEGSTEPLDPAIVPGGGLLGMRERAELLGGSLRVERPSPGGFLVEARLPLRRGR